VISQGILLVCSFDCFWCCRGLDAKYLVEIFLDCRWFLLGDLFRLGSFSHCEYCVLNPEQIRVKLYRFVRFVQKGRFLGAFNRAFPTRRQFRHLLQTAFKPDITSKLVLFFFSFLFFCIQIDIIQSEKIIYSVFSSGNLIFFKTTGASI